MQTFLLLRFERRKFCTKMLGSVLKFDAIFALIIDWMVESLIFKLFSDCATTAGIVTVD